MSHGNQHQVVIGREGIAEPPTLRISLMVLLALLVFVLAIGARLPFLLVAPRVSPDATEYLNIARHLAAGDGPIFSIKSHLFDAKPVVRSTIGDRCFLYPAMVAIGLRLFPAADDVVVARATNLLFSALACVFCLVLFTRLFGWKIGGLAAVLVTINPGLIVAGVVPLSDQLFFLLSVVALTLYAAHASRSAARPSMAAAQGVVAGLAQLTRPTGVVLWVVLVVGHLLGRRRRAAVWLALGFALVTAPYAYFNWKLNGLPFYSVFFYNYTVAHFSEGSWHGLDREPLTPWQFVSRDPQRVARLIAGRCRTNLDMMASQLDWLWVLVVLLPVGWWRRARGAVLGHAGSNLLVYSVSWVGIGARRFLLPSYVLTLPFLLEAAARPRWARLRRAAPLLLACAFALELMNYVAQDIKVYRYRARAARSSAALTQLHKEAAAWLEHLTPAEAVVASNNPWLVNRVSRRPTVLCPVFDRPEQIRPFLLNHQVSAIVLFVMPDDPRARMLNSEQGRRAAVPILRKESQGRRLLIYRVKPVAGTAGTNK